MATDVPALGRVHSGSAPAPLSEWLDELPAKLFGGFDRTATRQLVARLDATYSDLVAERDHLLSEIGRLQGLWEGAGRHEQELAAEVDALSRALESSKHENESLADQLERARSRWDVELARARADLQQALDLAEKELAGYRRREAVLANLGESAKTVADRIRAEAREEAERLLRHARKRHREMLRDARRELRRVEAERLRVQELAADLRRDLRARVSATLNELDPGDGEDGSKGS